MSEEYSDGIDNNGSLRYEKTQNRDITSTIERLNRSMKYNGTSAEIVSVLAPIMKNDVERTFKDIWRNKHDSHSNPNHLSVSVDIVPPIHKKIHADGDTDKYFKLHKEYPFYYLLNLKVTFRFSPSENDVMKDDEASYGKWFIDNIVPSFNKTILEKAKKSLDEKFFNIFAFPLLDAINDAKDNIASDNSQKTIENSLNKVENKINVMITPVLKFAKQDDDTGVSSRFDSTDEMKSILITMISLALERILRG